MKKAIAILLLVAAAALMLCACGGKTGKNNCTGSWKCVDIPETMQFKTVTIDITDTSFTYTLTGDKTSTVVSGEAKATGDDSMVLYMQLQQQINNADKKVLQEKRAESSGSDADPVYASLGDDGKLTLTANTMKLVFKRA